MLTNHLGILLITQIDKIKRLTPQQANLKANTSSLAEVTLLHAKVNNMLKSGSTSPVQHCKLISVAPIWYVT